MFPWVFIGAGVIALVVIVLVIVSQCKKTAMRHSRITVPQSDYEKAADVQIRAALEQIRVGLTQLLYQQFDGSVPETTDAYLQAFEAVFPGRIGNKFVSVDALSDFVIPNRNLFLRGADTVGGVSMLPVTVHMVDTPMVYLDGLTVGYRSDSFQKEEMYQIRFLTGKAGDPIGKLIVFEPYQKK